MYTLTQRKQPPRVRPGPLNIPGCLSNYAKACNGEEVIDFPFPEYNYIFKDTYNMLIYQEQLSRLSMDMCGFTGPESDDLRKSTAKKDRAALLAMKDKFINGAVKNGHCKDKVEKLFDDMEEFSRYSFCLAHAISYSHLTYYTAYLKTHYPSEFFAACISLEDDPDQKSRYIDDARANGLNVLPPDINFSSNGFTIAKDGSILFGFNGIKGLGPAVIKKLIEFRPFSSFSDFLIKSTVNKIANKKAIEALIHTGALDSFGVKHSSMQQSFEKFILDFTNNGKLKEFSSADISSFAKKEDEYFKINIDEYSVFEILKKEKELMGIHISGNPFDIIGSIVNEDFYPVKYIEERINGTSSKYRGYVLCEILKVKKHQLKNGNIMAFVDCKDHDGSFFSLTFFAETWTKHSEVCYEGNYIIAFADFTVGDRGFSSVVLNVIDLSSKIEKSNISYVKVYKKIGLHLIGIPSSARLKTIQNKLDQYYQSDGVIFIDIYLDVDETILFVKSVPVKNNDQIEMIRDLNKIPDIYITRIDSK